MTTLFASTRRSNTAHRPGGVRASRHRLVGCACLTGYAHQATYGRAAGRALTLHLDHLVGPIASGLPPFGGPGLKLTLPPGLPSF